MSLVLILDASESTSQTIDLYCEILGYETVVSDNLSICDAFQERRKCRKQEPCVDIMFVDNSLAKTVGLDVIQSQIERGCKLEPRNKALLANSLSSQEFKNAKRLGYHVLQTPITFEILENWLSEVEWNAVEKLKSAHSS